MFRTCPVRNGTCATERNPDGSIKGTIYFTGGNAGEPCRQSLTAWNGSWHAALSSSVSLLLVSASNWGKRRICHS